jgi:hypothetical protein
MKGRQLTIWIVLLAGCLALALPQRSWAGGWIRGVAGYSGYSMDDINDAIEEINSAIYPYELDELNGGLLYGLQLGLQSSPRTAFYLGYERLSGSSDVSDASGKIEVSVPANCFLAGAEYLFDSTSSAKFGLGGALGLVSASGGAEIAATGVGGQSADYSGSALMFQGYGLARIPVGKQVAILPQIGYRFANISDPEVDGGDAIFELDYTGFVLKAALQVSFGQ